MTELNFTNLLETHLDTLKTTAEKLAFLSGAQFGFEQAKATLTAEGLKTCDLRGDK